MCHPFGALFTAGPPPGLTPWAKLCRPFGAQTCRAGALPMPLHPHFFATPAAVSRRQFLARAGQGFGLLALNGLLRAADTPVAHAPGSPVLNPLAPRPPHFPAK